LECLLAAEQIEARAAQKIRIARLYMARANLAQAQTWFSRALDDTATREQALLGLLETAVRAKRFADAEVLMGRLDAEYPSRLDQTDLAVLRPQLLEWRRHQDEAVAALAALEERPALSERGAAMEPETNAVAQAASEHAATETSEEAEVVVASEGTGAEGEAAIAPEGEAIVEEPVPDLSPDKVTEARTFVEVGDLRGAVSAFKQALVENDARPEVWAELSEVYLALGEDRWAQATASEAARRDATNPKYALQYLRAAQRLLPPERLTEEMEAALRRFPGQPEIMLVLARAYAEQGSVRNARILYEALLREAPDHPQRSRVEAELSQLGR
jgi:tetratricopeptide (TPR) repeat protein